MHLFQSSLVIWVVYAFIIFGLLKLSTPSLGDSTVNFLSKLWRFVWTIDATILRARWSFTCVLYFKRKDASCYWLGWRLLLTVVLTSLRHAAAVNQDLVCEMFLHQFCLETHLVDLTAHGLPDFSFGPSLYKFLCPFKLFEIFGALQILAPDALCNARY